MVILLRDNTHLLMIPVPRNIVKAVLTVGIFPRVLALFLKIMGLFLGAWYIFSGLQVMRDIWFRVMKLAGIAT